MSISTAGGQVLPYRTLSGFSPFKRAGIVLNATETVRVPVELSVGTLDSTIEVSAEAPLLQTDRTSVSGAIEALPNITAAL